MTQNEKLFADGPAYPWWLPALAPLTILILPRRTGMWVSRCGWFMAASVQLVGLVFAVMTVLGVEFALASHRDPLPRRMVGGTTVERPPILTQKAAVVMAKWDKLTKPLAGAPGWKNRGRDG